MKFYKIINHNTFVGVITSNNFIKYHPVINGFLRADELVGEYVDYNCGLYRDSWMQPYTKEMPYTSVYITEIDEDEYNAFVAAIENNENIYITDPSEPTTVEEPEVVSPIETTSVEFIRSSKLKEMSVACRAAIEDGFDLELRGETRHFSLTTQDQLNLMSLSTMTQTQQLIPYHADGEVCEFYTADEINSIIAAATEFKNYNTVYYNSLKTYINALETVEEISAITYGVIIPDEYKSDVLKVLEY